MYRAWIEEVLGIKRRRDFLHIDPVIPSNWVGYKLTYRHGDAIYEVDVQNPDRVQSGVRSVTLDGRRMESQEIPLDDRSIRHSVTVILGESND
jgi:cyclic beta-1,2-glucan synthetase